MGMQKVKNKVDKIFITNLPSFYKINLYNKIAEHLQILVIFIGHSSQGRNDDFYRGDIKFPFINLGPLSNFKKCRELITILRKTNYKEVIIGGWDHITAWITVLLSPRKKNAVVVESSYLESTTRGLKGKLKQFYITRTSKAYVSGKSQKRIFDNLDYKGEVIITKGVGIFNYISQPPYIKKDKVSKFLYVGRFVDVKNLEFLIDTFNKIEDCELYLAGFGILEIHLKSIASENIHFLGAVENKKLPQVYQSMDVFILPSKLEPWGLVVEEALNNGLPVIVSNKVGCAEEIINESNGLVFNANSQADLFNSIGKMKDLNFYNTLRKNISLMDFSKIEEEQVSKYLE